MSEAIDPPAPGRFSGTTGWPQSWLNFEPMKRPVVSTPPPGASAMTMRIAFVGYAGACACAAPAAQAPADRINRVPADLPASVCISFSMVIEK